MVQCLWILVPRLPLVYMAAITTLDIIDHWLSAALPCNQLPPTIPTATNRSNIHDITLSYTFYKVDDEDASNLDDEGGVRIHNWMEGPLPPNITLAPGVVLPPGIGLPAAEEAAAAAAAGEAVGKEAAPVPAAAAKAAGGG